MRPPWSRLCHAQPVSTTSRPTSPRRSSPHVAVCMQYSFMKSVISGSLLLNDVPPAARTPKGRYSNSFIVLHMIRQGETGFPASCKLRAGDAAIDIRRAQAAELLKLVYCTAGLSRNVIFLVAPCKMRRSPPGWRSKSARPAEVPRIRGIAKAKRTLVREPPGSREGGVPRPAAAASASSAVRQNGGTKRCSSPASSPRCRCRSRRRDR